MSTDREALRRAYDAMAGRRAASAVPAWRIEARERFVRVLRDGHARSIVDLGCGPGHDAGAFVEAGLVTYGVDLAPANVDHALTRGVDAVVGDLVDTGLPDDVVDAAWSTSTVLHLDDEDLRRAAAEIGRIVRPSGPVCIGTWGGVDRDEVWRHDEYDPQRRFVFRSDDRLAALLGPALIVEATLPGPQAPTSDDLRYQWVHARVP